MSWIVYTLYGALLGSALVMVLCVNPIHSVICFISTFLCASIIFTLLHADFIGLVFLMVYVGAIAVLFIFVVMMLNVKRIERDNTTYLLIGGFIALLFTIQLCYIILSSYTLHSSENVLFSNQLSYDSLSNNDEFMQKYFVQSLGVQIFSEDAIILIFAGILLLVSLISAVYLTNTKNGYNPRRQDNQISRTSKVYNLHTY